MRIVKVTGAYPPAFRHGGTATCAHALCKGLIHLGHEVFVFTTDRDGTGRLDVPRGETSYDRVPVRYCRWIRCPLPYYSIELVDALRRRLATVDIVLIDSAWTTYGALAARECRRRGVPYLVYPHGSHDPVVLRKGRVKKFIWWHLVDRALYDGAAAVVALTQAEAEQVKRMGVRARIEQIPNGVDMSTHAGPADRNALERRFPKLQARRFILFVGRLTWKKGLELLVSAFAHVHAKHAECLLVIAGPDEGGYKSKVEQLVKELGLAEDVLFTGMVVGKVKAALLKAAEVFVLSSYSEGLPTAPLEAMACGTPVVITEACNLPEVKEFGAGVVTDTTPKSVAAALAEVLGDEGGRREMGKRAKDLVAARFGWEQLCQRTAALCQDVVSGYG
jgi:glycosyltransferase involved in cell wall biosynthesis